MIYLDNAATTLKKPDCVRQAVYEAMESLGNPGRGGHEAALAASRAIYGAREALSSLFDLHNPAGVAFTGNATEALNTVISGLFEEGDHVITTALEHNSVLRPLYREAQKGLEITILSSDEKGRISYGDMEAAITSNTKAIVCTHGSNVTGNVLDIARIGDICRRHGIYFVLDASQTAGELPISMEKCFVDVLCFTGHKALMGPQGTGGICVKDGIEIRPLKVGGSGIHSFSKEHPSFMPERLEAGTLNGHGIAGLAAAVEFLENIGLENIREKTWKLANTFYQGIKDIDGIQIYGDMEQIRRVPVVSLNLENWDAANLADELAGRFDIYTRAGAHCAPLMHQALGTVENGAVRFSFSWYNSVEEVEKTVEALKELAGR